MQGAKHLINYCLYKSYRCCLSVLIKMLTEVTVPHLEKAVQRNWASVHQSGCSGAQKFWQTDRHRVLSQPHSNPLHWGGNTAASQQSLLLKSHLSSSQTPTLPHQKPWETSLQLQNQNAGALVRFRKAILAPTGERSHHSARSYSPISLRSLCHRSRSQSPMSCPYSLLPLPEASCRAAACAHRAATAPAVQNRAQARTIALKQMQTSSRKEQRLPSRARQTAGLSSPNRARSPAGPLSAPREGGTRGG